MKFIIPAVALFTAAVIAVAVPEGQGWYLRRADEMDMEDLPIVDLTVTDDRFEGITFSGTAESIWNQMTELNPDIMANDTETTLETRSQEKRQSSFNCGWGDYVGDYYNCVEGLQYLERLGSAWCSVANAPACARVSCSNNCGMFLCNKINAPWRVGCNDIKKDVIAISNECANVFGQIRGARDFSTHFIGLGRQGC